jgi:ketosteroid isomerase-like protein
MSRENTEAARRLIEAFNRRDLAAMVRGFDDEIEWEPGGPAAVERSLYRGRDEVSAGFLATWEAWEVFRFEEHEVRDLADSILWLGRAQLRGGTSHVELDQEFAIRFLIDRGKIARIEGFQTWQAALEAVGLRE